MFGRILEFAIMLGTRETVARHPRMPLETIRPDGSREVHGILTGEGWRAA